MQRLPSVFLLYALISACPSPPEPQGLPCDVAALVSTKCAECHGSPLAYSAPQPLYTRGHFAAKSTVDPDATFAQRSLLRMKQPSNPMPPANAPPLTAQELGAFEQWVAGGLPGGSCATDLDAGLPIDAGTPPLTCVSGVKLPRPTTTAPNGGEEMAPGWACIACHRGINFQGQNPFGALGMTGWYDVMGTVYGARHEEDLCASSVADAGIVVEIYDSTGALALTTTLRGSGNFYVSAPMDAGISLPSREGEARRAGRHHDHAAGERRLQPVPHAVRAGRRAGPHRRAVS